MQSVAETLGFGSLSAFGHWFHRRFECSASRYRAQVGRAGSPAAMA